VARREGVGERSEHAERLVDRLVCDVFVDGGVEALFHRGDATAQSLAVWGEAQCEVPPVCRVDFALDKARSHETVHQPARAVAGLADQELAKAGESERPEVTENADHFGLGGGDAKRP